MDSDGRRPGPSLDQLTAKRRLPLGRSARRLSFERQLRLWTWCFSLPLWIALFWYCRQQHLQPLSIAGCSLLVMLLWSLVASYFVEQITRPLQTLSNIVAALREDDFSFRARGAMRGDALGDLALEINTLASTLQTSRNAAMDALTLADRVIGSMQSPVLAFDNESRLRLLNTAAQHSLQLPATDCVGSTAAALTLQDLLNARDQSVVSPQRSSGLRAGPSPRWSLRRTVFRLNGVPHTLIVLSDVDAALREEERTAWQRIIRVLSHEINNSLTPIKSVANMLRSRPLRLATDFHTSQDLHDIRRGLAMIEDRADSLNRFLQAYQQLSRLPSPRMQLVSVATLVEQSALLERRVPIQTLPSPDLHIYVDPDQLQQLLINVFKNAAEAAGDLELSNAEPCVQVSWQAVDGTLALAIVDNGPGLANPANLFVPFYTTKPEGSGIGLTLCQQIAAVHHGSIRLRNRTGQSGCLVELTLPLASRPGAIPADISS